jgi:hypothetical protein
VISSLKNLSLHDLGQWAVGEILFLATATVVMWQNSRLTVLYDLCGVLEPAARMAQGDLPYRDFPFPYPPLTFLTQAAIIRLFGAVYWHHIIYAAVIGGLGTVLTWRILVNLFRDWLPRPALTAFLLSLPLAILGIYCIFPHPFYDPDAMFVILISILLSLRLERKGFPLIRSFLLGMLLAVPLFIKQNIGLAFLGSIGLALLIMIIKYAWQRKSVIGLIAILLGIAVGVGVALSIVRITVGLDNYKLWTITYATARRTPSVTDMLSVYNDWLISIWVVAFLIGSFILRRNAEGKRWRSILSLTFMAAGFVWPVVYLFIDSDASERAERLVGLWPVMFIVSFALTYFFTRRLSGIARALPFILIATAHGVFLSQQLWGSTYGIWPMLVILIGLVLLQLYEPTEERGGGSIIALAAVASISLIVAGGFYGYSNERLDYVDYEDGDMTHSSLPQLQGLSMRGSYLPDFEELVKYADENIPREDGILLLPGEDLFYYTTRRRPHFPVLLFDVTNNPYNADEIREKVLTGDIEWIILKNDLQIEADTMINDKDRIFEDLKPDFRHIESLNNYEIYRRRHTNDAPDDEGDDGDDSDNSDNDSGN